MSGLSITTSIFQNFPELSKKKEDKDEVLNRSTVARNTAWCLFHSEYAAAEILAELG